MASSSIPCDISSTDEILPTTIRYENNHKYLAKCNLRTKVGFDMEIPNVDGDFDGVNEHYVVEMHFKNLQTKIGLETRLLQLGHMDIL
jgi:hypothetical protein